jgi:uncharacterized membrane protein (UPF0127 family)
MDTTRLIRRLSWGLLTVTIPLSGVRAQVAPQLLPIEAKWCLASGTCIQLEVADEQREQAIGLQLRDPLPPLRGMWFPHRDPQILRYWMHRCNAALDMLFIRDDRVISIEANVPPCPRLPCPSYGPDELADEVVELGAGEAQRLGIKIGSPAVIRPFKPLSAARPATPSRD